MSGDSNCLAIPKLLCVGPNTGHQLLFRPFWPTMEEIEPKAEGVTKQAPTEHELRGFRFTVREAIAWTVVVSLVLASPTWFGEHAIQICFYSVLALSTWRFSKFMPVLPAAILGVTMAIILSALMVGWVQP